MSAINFVVRDGAGNISRGTAGEGAASSIISVGAGSDISLNLSQNQIVSYTRSGDALQITLVDGQVITVDGYFAPGAANELFLSTDGFLTEVNLTQGAGADYFANYALDDGVGKFAENDSLYFMRGSDVLRADSSPADDEVGMLGAAIGGIGPLFGWGGAAAAAGVGAAALGGGGGGGASGPGVDVTEGTVESSGNSVNEESHGDGVEIVGTGTPGGEVDVTIGDTTETTTVSEDGDWSVTFGPEDIDTGEYTADVTVTITTEDGSTTVTETLVVDTVIGAEMNVAGGADGIINAQEHEGGVTLTGTVTGGDAVVVTIDGVDYNATVTDGTWSVDLGTSVLGEGEYEVDVTITATDAAGNSSTSTSTVVVDTVTSVTVETATVGGTDNVVNGTEQSSGVTLTGTAQPGASVEVTFGTVTQTVIATSGGTWSASYASADVPTGELDVPVTVVATDGAGNTATATSSVTIDTFVNELEMTSNSAGASDAVVNFDERGDAITMAGTVEAGSTVSVSLHGVVMAATVDDSGNWSVSYPSGTLPEGEYETSVTVTATDAAGNVSEITDQVKVDTFVNTLTSTDPVEGDNIVNSDEAADGVTLTGTVEAGSTVSVTFAVPGGSITEEARVDSNGNWSVTFPAAEIPGGEYDANITIAATDAYGNTDSITDTFRVDTTAEDAPTVEAVTINDDGVRGLEIHEMDHDFTVSSISDSGVVTLEHDQDSGVDLGDTQHFTFNPELSSGTHLVVNGVDDAGNENATYVVMEETRTDVVTLDGLDGFDVGSIDLSFATDSELSLDLAALEGLSDNDNTLIIHGGSDDSVNIAGATDSGTSTTIEGKTYDVYTMGDDAQIFIEEDINVSTI